MSLVDRSTIAEDEIFTVVVVDLNHDKFPIFLLAEDEEHGLDEGAQIATTGVCVRRRDKFSEFIPLHQIKTVRVICDATLSDLDDIFICAYGASFPLKPTIPLARAEYYKVFRL